MYDDKLLEKYQLLIDYFSPPRSSQDYFFLSEQIESLESELYFWSQIEWNARARLTDINNQAALSQIVYSDWLEIKQTAISKQERIKHKKQELEYKWEQEKAYLEMKVGDEFSF